MTRNVNKLIKDYLEKDIKYEVSDIHFYPSVDNMVLIGTYRSNDKTFSTKIDVIELIAFAYLKE